MRVQVDENTLREIQKMILRPVTDIFDDVNDIVQFIKDKGLFGIDTEELQKKLLEADKEMEQFMTRVVDYDKYYPNEYRVYIFKIKVNSKTYYVVSTAVS